MKPRNWSVLATLVGSWLWAGDAAKADEPIHRMLPLTVGNSWRYVHTKYDASTYEQLYHHQVTISISHTEVIEGHTYHVFSDVPYDEPPVPFFFIAGKRVRWEGDRLLFRERDQDVALFRFGGYPVDEIGDYSYVIPTSESDTPVYVADTAYFPGVPRRDGCLVPVGRTFTFYFGERKHLDGRTAAFLEDFGMLSAYTPDSGGLHVWDALIDGERRDFWVDPTGKTLAAMEEEPCLLPSTLRRFSWGVLKHQFIQHLP